MQEPSIFTRMLQGEIPYTSVFEDEHCFVILTHEPFTPGHCLVIPKRQIDQFWDVSNELYDHLTHVARKIALRLREIYEYERVGLLVEGYGVPHAHIHVFGFEQPLEPTVVNHIDHKRIASPDELKIEADKFLI